MLDPVDWLLCVQDFGSGGPVGHDAERGVTGQRRSWRCLPERAWAGFSSAALSGVADC